MNILVTGGLGHIGSKLIREYGNRDDVSLLRKVMKDIDIVIHLASVTDAPSTINNPELTEKVIFNGTWNVLNTAMHEKVKRFLYASTTSVYGEAEGIVDENVSEDLYKPASPYALAKRKTEKLLEEIGKHTGFPVIILRKGTIFGTSIGMRFHTAINKFCYLAALNKPLTVWDSAINSKRPYLGLNDCINAYKFFETNGEPGEVYNIVTKNYEMQEILETIKKIIPVVKIEITKSPIINQKPYHASNEKMKSLGFEFKDDLRSSMKETIELFRRTTYVGIDNLRSE